MFSWLDEKSRREQQILNIIQQLEKLSGEARLEYLKVKLVENGEKFDIDMPSPKGTLLMEAISSPDDHLNVSMAKLMLSVGANIDLFCQSGSALTHSLEKYPQNLLTIKFLIENGARVNMVFRKKVSNFPTIKSYQNLFSTLIRMGLDPSLLIYSAVIYIDDELKTDFKTTLEMLLEAGANPNISIKNKNSLLSILLDGYLSLPHEKLSEIILLLHKYGADLNFVDNCSESILIKMAKLEGLPEIKVLLDFLQKGLVRDLHLNNKLGLDALHYAVRNKGSNIEIMRLLFEAGLKFNIAPNINFMGIFGAAYENDKYILLIENGLDVNFADNEHNTFLMHMIASSLDDRRLPVIALLLKSYVTDLDVCNCNGHSYLTEAIRGDNFIIVNLLLNYGADYKKMHKGKYFGADSKSFLSFIDFENTSHRRIWDTIQKIEQRKFTMEKIIFKEIIEIKDKYALRPSSMTPQLMAIKWRLMQDSVLKVFEQLQATNPLLLHYMAVDRADMLGYKVMDLLKHI